MPRKAPRLAEEGRVRGEEEYIEWAARVSAEAEDIRESVTEERWKAHYREKYAAGLSYDPEKAERQLKGLWDRGMRRQWEDLPDVGVIPSTRYTPRGYYYQYRDVATGRFVGFSEVARRIPGLIP